MFVSLLFWGLALAQDTAAGPPLTAPNTAEPLVLEESADAKAAEAEAKASEPSSGKMEAVGLDHSDIVEAVEHATSSATQGAVKDATSDGIVTDDAPAPACVCEAKAPKNKPKPPGTLSAELGGAWATGNSEFLSINGRILGSYEKKNNKFSGEASFLYSMSISDANDDGTVDDEEREVGYSTDAQRVGGHLGYDRIFGRNGIYVVVDSLHDPLAGIDYRFGQAAGYRRELVDTKVTTLSFDVGLQTGQEFYANNVLMPSGVTEVGSTDDFGRYQFVFGGLGGIDLTIRFNDHVQFTNSADIFGNFLGTRFAEEQETASGTTYVKREGVDIRVHNHAALQVAMSKRFGLKLSNLLRYKSMEVSDFRKVDSTTTVSLVATIF